MDSKSDRVNYQRSGRSRLECKDAGKDRRYSIMEWTPPETDIRLNLEMHNYSGPHDYFNKEYVDEWVSIANSRRPFRQRIFESFAAELRKLDYPLVLDLGSGPGFWLNVC